MSVTALPLPLVVPLDKDVSEVNTVPKSTTPDVGLFVVPFIFTPVTVPAFLVNPQPLTVDSVGIVVVSGNAPTSDAVYVGFVEAFAQAETSLAGRVVG